MMIPVYGNRKKAKVRFFAAYALSVLLFLVLFSSFLKPTAQIVEKFEPLVAGKPDQHSAIYQTLHQRMEKLDQVCVKVAANRSTENLALLLTEENAFYASIDSVRKSFISFSAPQKEKELVALLEAFTRAAEKQTSLARGIAPTGEAHGAYSALNDQLLEKEKRISELENQNKILLQEAEMAKSALQNSPSEVAVAIPQPSGRNESEWRVRYETMKAAHDRIKESNNKYATQVNDLKKSYKDVVDDNRRLLAQLQTARAGRN